MMDDAYINSRHKHKNKTQKYKATCSRHGYEVHSRHKQILKREETPRQPPRNALRRERDCLAPKGNDPEKREGVASRHTHTNNIR